MKSACIVGVFTSLSLAAGLSVGFGQESATAPSFDVVSIRQVLPGAESRDGLPEVELTADGWRLNDESLFAAIINAFTPPAGGSAFYTPKEVKGLPRWAMDERYVINAKIEEGDIAKWRDPAAQTDLLLAMMRSMLADRCKLLVHRETTEVPIYSLVLRKGGPKFKETVPGVPHPVGGAIPGGGEFLASD
ncbi:MAG: TIGR03435 family protein, partial [Granulicella sp.]